jgi:hypothetical protein
MTATFDDVEGWKKRGKEMGASYIISVCDSFDYDDYPVYVMPGENLEEKKKGYDGTNMQRINEVITL